MRVQLTRRHDDGAIAIIVALLSVVLIGMAAFAIDFGNAYAVKRQLSVAVDASALDAARAVAGAKVGTQPILGGGRGCATWSSAQRAAANSAAQATAAATNAANDLSGASTVDRVTVTCVGDSRVEVEVVNSRSLTPIFGGVFGADNYVPARSATAAIVARLGIGGLKPYVACNTVVDAAEAAPGVTFVMDLDNKIGVCNTTAPGQWGIVDFDGGSNPTGDIEDWTEFGYPGQVFAPNPALPADPGANLGPVRNELDTIVDQVVLFPVVTGFTQGPGNNASFNLVGFVAAKVCGYYVGIGSPTQGSCYDAAKAAPYISANPRVRFIQFQYFDRFTGGYAGGGPTCNFTDPSCKYAILSAQLYR
ncbi:MAG: pilus assembly protein [Actinomycetota bacterium]|nr:pilus assembly protein [Actinomycetota bacterium]